MADLTVFPIPQIPNGYKTMKNIFSNKEVLNNIAKIKELQKDNTNEKNKFKIVELLNSNRNIYQKEIIENKKINKK